MTELLDVVLSAAVAALLMTGMLALTLWVVCKLPPKD